jgi:hypothetical protein
MIGHRSYLAGCAVADLEVCGPAAHVDAERSPRKWMLEDPLPDVSSKEQPVTSLRRDCRKEGELGGAKVLRFINHDMVERLLACRCVMLAEMAIDTGPGEELLFF